VLGRVGWSFVVRFDPRGRPIKYVLEEDVHEEDEEDAREKKEVLDQEVHELDHPVIGSHPMHHVDDDDYIDDDLVLDIPDVVMDNPFNDFEGLDTNFDLDELDIELDEVQDQSELDM
jgi:hypothetical protein